MYSRMVLQCVVASLMAVMLLAAQVVCARPLSADEMDTLSNLDGNWQSKHGENALRLAQQLGKECNLEASAQLVQLRRSILMNRFVNAVQCDSATPQMQALALGLAKDSSFERDDESWDTRSQFFRLIHDYQSRELWEILYAASRRDLIARQAGNLGLLPVSMRSIGGTITPRSVPDIEQPIAALLPLLPDACRGYGYILFLRERHYVPALGALRDLYARTPGARCANEITYTLGSFQMPQATQAIVARIDWALGQAQSADRDQELATGISALGAQRIEAQVDLEALEKEVLNAPMPAQSRSKFELLFKQQMAVAHMASDFTPDNLVNWIASMNVELTRSFLQHGVDVNAVDSHGEMPLTKAVFVGNMDIVSLLVLAGADPNARNRVGNLPLHIACAAPSIGGPGAGDVRSANLVSYLLAYGARANEADGVGMTALHHAAIQHNVPVLDLLLTHGADVNAKKLLQSGGFVGATPLHYAVRQANTRTASYLLDHGADINARLEDGTTALLIATSLGKNYDVGRVLVERGADVSAGTSDGVTPILVAHELGDTQMESLLRSKGAFLNPITVARRALVRAFAAMMIGEMH